MRRFPHSLTLLFAGALLAACSSTRMDAPVNDDWQVRRDVLSGLSHWEFTGRIGVRDDRESHSSRIRWRQNQDDYVINLWGALNVGATEITGTPRGVRLLQEGKAALTAATPEDLVEEHLGYDLPVSQLRYWIKGMPSPGSTGLPSFNKEHHLVSLEQDGWTVQYLAYTQYEAESLPTRIRIEKPPLRLDFVRLDWTFLP